MQSIEFVGAKYDEMWIKHKNMEARSRSEKILDKIDDLEQYGRCDCVEIPGIPVQKDESTDELVCSIRNLVNINIKLEDLSVMHRLKHSTRSKFPPAIIAKFVRREVRDKLYQAIKYLKNKTTTDLGLGGYANNKIYIAESLTRKNKDSFNKSLETKRSMNKKFIWTRQGKIYLRKDTTTPKKLISSMFDLTTLS